MKRHRPSWPPRRERDPHRSPELDPQGGTSPRNPVIGLFGRTKDGESANGQAATGLTGHELRRVVLGAFG
jgi:hypothetical protein